LEQAALVKAARLMVMAAQEALLALIRFYSHTAAVVVAMQVTMIAAAAAAAEALAQVELVVHQLGAQVETVTVLS
jgi:hypothetical protein